MLFLYYFCKIISIICVNQKINFMSFENVPYLNIDENLFCIYLVNKHEQKVIQKDIDSTFLQFHFVLEEVLILFLMKGYTN